MREHRGNDLPQRVVAVRGKQSIECTALPLRYVLGNDQIEQRIVGEKIERAKRD